jgi:hypothetical protein
MSTAASQDFSSESILLLHFHYLVDSCALFAPATLRFQHIALQALLPKYRREGHPSRILNAQASLHDTSEQRPLGAAVSRLSLKAGLEVKFSDYVWSSLNRFLHWGNQGAKESEFGSASLSSLLFGLFRSYRRRIGGRWEVKARGRIRNLGAKGGGTFRSESPQHGQRPWCEVAAVASARNQ